MTTTPVTIDSGGTQLAGELATAPDTKRIVVFVHGSGSSRMSPGNRRIAEALQERGLGTLLLDLRSAEEQVASRTALFDPKLVADRLVSALEWLVHDSAVRDARLGLFAEGTGAAAALLAASRLRDLVGAVVSRGGKPELAGAALSTVQAPTLLIVGGADRESLAGNRNALARLACPRALHVVEGAGAFLDERAAFADVIAVSGAWFDGQLADRPSAYALGPSSAVELSDSPGPAN